MADVSSTRLYLGGLPRNVTKQEIEKHFEKHGTGKITEIKLMNGFGFLEYEDAMDARDVVPAFHGSEMNGSRITVQFARGARHKENFSGPADRAAPRPRRTIYRMVIEGLAPETSWQDLKDFARDGASVDVVYSETDRARDGKGFVEFETRDDLKAAVEKLDGRDYKGGPVTCREDIQDERPDYARNYRQRSPPPRRSYPPPTATTDLHPVTTGIASARLDRHVAATTTTRPQETTAAARPAKRSLWTAAQRSVS